MTLSRPLERYTRLLSQPNALNRIRNDFVSTFRNDDDFVVFAGAPEDVPQLSILLTKILSDSGEMDRLRFLFTTKFAKLKIMDSSLCDSYILALARSGTFSALEIRSTVSFLEHRGWRPSSVARLALAEMRIRSGIIDEGFWDDSMEIDRTNSVVERIVDSFLTISACVGATTDTCRLFLWLTAGDENAVARAVRPSFVMACVKSHSVEGSLRYQVVAGALKHSLVPDDKLIEAIVKHLDFEFSFKLIQHTDGLDWKLNSLLAVGALENHSFEAAAQFIETGGTTPQSWAVWIQTLANEGAEAVDAFYFTLEHRAKAGRPVTTKTLNLVLWACRSLGDDVRANQTLAAFENFGVVPNADSTEAVAGMAYFSKRLINAVQGCGNCASVVHL